LVASEPEGKRLLRKHKIRWKDNIEIEHEGIQYNDVDWIRLAYDKVQ
jgi:hypothetical protein